MMFYICSIAPLREACKHAEHRWRSPQPYTTSARSRYRLGMQAEAARRPGSPLPRRGDPLIMTSDIEFMPPLRLLCHVSTEIGKEIIQPYGLSEVFLLHARIFLEKRLPGKDSTQWKRTTIHLKSEKKSSDPIAPGTLYKVRMPEKYL